jgi:hypothetical protein
MSLFQSDTVGLKLRLPIDWAMRSPAGIAWRQGAAFAKRTLGRG